MEKKGFLENAKSSQKLKVLHVLLVLLAVIAGICMSSCTMELKGGTFELFNDTRGSIDYILSTSPISSVNFLTLSSGKTATLNVREDTKVYYMWRPSNSITPRTGNKEVTGGQRVRVTAQ